MTILDQHIAQGPLSVTVAFALAALLTACSGKVVQSSNGADSEHNGSSPILHASCTNQTLGADHQCGLNRDQDCCADVPVSGGTFDRYNYPEWPATVSDFRIGKMEVTVGRVRAFVNAWPNAWPHPGDGANPHVDGSGWRKEWDQYLPKTRQELIDDLHCPYETYPPRDHTKWDTWTDEPGPHEYAAAGCLTWFDAFAFCAWDGGRLPSEAELEYVIVGGEQQRPYPWGTEPPSSKRVVAGFPGDNPFIPVGSRPAGTGRWGVLDLGGGFREWTADLVADYSAIESPILLPCQDCQATTENVGTARAIDKDNWWTLDLDPHDKADFRGAFMTIEMREALGFRCAYPVRSD